MQYCKKQIRLVFIILVFLLLAGCATSFHPRPMDEIPFQDRVQTQEKENVRVSAAVLSAEETQELFSLDLYKRGIQPIWLEIENNTDEPVFFLPAGIDPEYFAPLEVAYMHHGSFSADANKRMDRYFHEHRMKSYVPPGDVRSGFAFTNTEQGTKRFVVDLIGDHLVRSFTFFMTVPGLKTSHQDVDWDNLYEKDDWIFYKDEAPFRKALNALPCCTTDAGGTRQGDPLNVVIIARSDDLHRTLIRSGWDETEKGVSGDNAKQSSSNPTEQYRYAPVSPQYLFGRPQDAAFRKSRQSVGERNQLRLWLAPIQFEDKPVWVGQISREIKVRFLPNAYQIEPLVDEARMYLLQNLWLSQSLAKFGHVRGVGKVAISTPRKSFNDDPYFTDGLRLVVALSGASMSVSDVEFFDWAKWRPLKEDD